VDGVVEQDDPANPDDGRNQDQKQLKADSKTQAEPADINLAGLTAQEMETNRVFVLEMLPLGLSKT
jgi:hypothetical protein